jgi:hypothetical protein
MQCVRLPYHLGSLIKWTDPGDLSCGQGLGQLLVPRALLCGSAFVIRRKQEGLASRTWGVQNTCLLLKLIHKLHSEEVSSWATWVQNNASIASLTGDLHGQHWEMLRSLLPIYRAITIVLLGNGTTTSFWHDVWYEDDSMAEWFLELYTHCRMQEMTVNQAVQGELQNSLVPRRTVVADLQLGHVIEIIEQQQLQDTRDRRQSPLFKKNGEVDTSMLYRALKTTETSPDPWAKFVWNNKAPPRVKFFAWLLSQGKIQCKTNLAKKRIVQNIDCDVCQAAEETPAHVIFGCPAAKQFWEAVQIQTDENWNIQALQGITQPPHIPAKHFETFILLCCWHIWKRRNNTVFRTITSLSGALAACKSEAFLWGACLRKKDKQVADAWCCILSNAM